MVKTFRGKFQGSYLCWALHCFARLCLALCCCPLHCFAALCCALHCVARLCIALLCIDLLRFLFRFYPDVIEIAGQKLFIEFLQVFFGSSVYGLILLLQLFGLFILLVSCFISYPLILLFSSNRLAIRGLGFWRFSFIINEVALRLHRGLKSLLNHFSLIKVFFIFLLNSFYCLLKTNWSLF